MDDALKNLRQNFHDNIRWLPVALIAIIITFFLIFRPNLITPSSPATSETNASLNRHLESERPSIEEAFTSRFNFLSDQYKIQKVVLLNKGSFAAILLYLNDVPYRTLLQKQNDTWSVIDLPYPVLSYFNFPNIPESIIDTINNLSFE